MASFVAKIISTLSGAVRLARGGEGNVSVVFALLLVPIVGGLAVGTEGASWYFLQRQQQTAADSAAITAALTSGSSSETDGVTDAYGLKTGTGNVTVNLTTPACPSGAKVISGATCYQVEIVRKVPIYLTRFAGFAGDTTIGSSPAKYISASAMAALTTGTNNFCMIGLSSVKLAGGNGTDLTGCALESGGSMQCSGQHSADGVPVAYSYGGQSGYSCGDSTFPNDSAISYADPLHDQVISAASKISGCQTSPGTITTLSPGMNCYIGPVKLGADITISSDTVLALEASASAAGGNPPANGGLDLNGHTITSASTSGGMTIVFTGTTAFNKNAQTIYNTANTGATLNIQNPLSGDWQGITIAVDPNLTGTNSGSNNSLDLSLAGGANNITLDVSGVIYDPKHTVNVNGAINHATNGYACIGIVAYTINITGTNSIFANPTSGCRDDHVTLNTVPVVALIH
jgi:hypothetical protein